MSQCMNRTPLSPSTACAVQIPPHTGNTDKYRPRQLAPNSNPFSNSEFVTSVVPISSSNSILPPSPDDLSPARNSSISLQDSSVAPTPLDLDYSVSGTILTRFQRSPNKIAEPDIPKLIDRRSSTQYFDAYCEWTGCSRYSLEF